MSIVFFYKEHDFILVLAGIIKILQRLMRNAQIVI